jgi:hypothetical protein
MAGTYEILSEKAGSKEFEVDGEMVAKSFIVYSVTLTAASGPSEKQRYRVYEDEVAEDVLQAAADHYDSEIAARISEDEEEQP